MDADQIDKSGASTTPNFRVAGFGFVVAFNWEQPKALSDYQYMENGIFGQHTRSYSCQNWTIHTGGEQPLVYCSLFSLSVCLSVMTVVIHSPQSRQQTFLEIVISEGEIENDVI